MVVNDTYFRAAKSGVNYIDATSRNAPQIGDYGIGVTSGTVFRVFADGTRVLMSPQIAAAFRRGREQHQRLGRRADHVGAAGQSGGSSAADQRLARWSTCFRPRCRFECRLEKELEREHDTR